MPFTYGTRTRQFISVGDADEHDRIKVTLESGQVVTLKKGTGWRALEVDRDLTDADLLNDMYQHVIKYERTGLVFRGLFSSWYRWRYNRTIPPLEEVRKLTTLEVSVSESGDAFDDSPRTGEQLCIMAMLPERGGSGWRVPSSIKAVEFYSL